MQYGIAFAPLVPTLILWIGAIAIVVISALLLLSRARGGTMRIAALALILLALSNPSFTREDREPLSSVVAVIVDKSPSQEFGERTKETEQAREELLNRLKAIKGIETRVVESGQSDGETDGTRLFSALSSALSDVPPDRVGGAFLITDGRVHDIPTNAAALGLTAPLHALITGRANEIDRRVALVTAPRFGIVGQQQTITFRVEDQGISGQRANVIVRRDGEQLATRTVQSGQSMRIEIPITHEGPNIVEIEAAAIDNELTLINNRAVVSIDGVRDKLRVLLVSGEPHSGERTWRNLLKSDASVDLVHFTILRPPEKQDGTPINELSLIAFPTRELFQQKINEFHLIIFDRYARQGVLPIAYFDNIARYVRNGGAVLVAAGPDYASTSSIWRTPLDTILPAEPVGVTEKAFLAKLSEPGKRHPVTRGLEGSASEPPQWSRFFRLVDTRNTTGSAVMEGADGKPMLVLARQGEGRVALLLSDHIWLWARGFEGGGPHIDLLRRLSHWLMKQPDLDEEALRLIAQGRNLIIQRQTMGETVQPVTVTSPSGKTRQLTMTAAEPGLWRASVPVDELGLWQATDGTLKALVNVGPANPKEFAEVTSTTELLAPLAQATGGEARRLVTSSALDLPRIVAVRASASSFRGDGWMGIRMRDASVVRGIGVLPVFAGILGLLLLVGAFAATWMREGR